MSRHKKRQPTTTAQPSQIQLGEAPVPHRDPTDPKTPTDLKSENEQLKKKLEAYQTLQEDLMAQKVFEKSKALLTGYLTIGGVLLVLAGVVGVMQIVDYAKGHAKDTINDVVEKESKKALIEETERQKKSLGEAVKRMQGDVSALGLKKQSELEQIAAQQANRLLSVGQPVGAISKPATTASGMVDYSGDMGPIRDEGNLGSAVGFAVAAALEYQIWKTAGKRVTISPLYIYYKARELEGTTDHDAGAKLANAIKVLQQTGAVAEDVWPYRIADFNKKPPESVAKAEHYKITESRPVRGTKGIKSALLEFGPVAGAVTIYESFVSASNGKFPMPGPGETMLGSTAFCFVGFDDGKRLLKFRNQWGPGWGDKGYGYMPYEYADRFLDDAIVFSMKANH